MSWSSLSWKWIPPGTPRTSLGLPCPPAPLGPPPSVSEQRRLIPWVPDKEPRFAVLGIDYHMLCHDHYWVDCRRCAYLWEVRRSALWALDAQHSSMRATQQTQKALEDCAVHVSSYLLIGEASGKHRSCVCEQFNCLSCE